MYCEKKEKALAILAFNIIQNLTIYHGISPSQPSTGIFKGTMQV